MLYHQWCHSIKHALTTGSSVNNEVTSLKWLQAHAVAFTNKINCSILNQNSPDFARFCWKRKDNLHWNFVSPFKCANSRNFVQASTVGVSVVYGCRVNTPVLGWKVCVWRIRRNVLHYLNDGWIEFRWPQEQPLRPKFGRNILSWTDHERQISLSVEKEKNIPRITKIWKDNWIGHILCRNCLLKHVTEGKKRGRIEVTER